MNIYSLPKEQNCIPNTPRAVALGVFDGVHIGHRAVIGAALDGDTRCAVYTFIPATVTTKPTAQQITVAEELYRLLEQSGVQDVFEQDFAAVRQMSPAEFVESILVNTLHATTITCGYNYRFGNGGIGDATLLTELCAQHGITVTVVPPVVVDGVAVSSTAIRAAIAAGDMAAARRMLGRAVSMRLPVQAGQHLGHRLGMPTINQVLPIEWVTPRFGVYASSVEIDDDVYIGVSNIGIRPTVGADAPLAETWILDYDGDLYGKTVTVNPIQFLRDECKFDSLDALREQVRTDADRAAALFAPTGHIRAVLFDFDDTLHPRDDAFYGAAERFAKSYFPTLDDEAQTALAEKLLRISNHGLLPQLPLREMITDALGENADAATIEDAFRRFLIDYAKCSVLTEDVEPTLTALREEGYIVGVITNGYSVMQNSKLTLSGLRPMLDILAVGGDEGIGKPHAAIFRRVAARLGVAVEDCVYVGDNPKNDMQGAYSAGMRVIWMDNVQAADHPRYAMPLPPHTPVIHTIAALPTLLQQG